MVEGSLRDNYEEIWKMMWGDMQRYGPVHRHQRRIYRYLLENMGDVQIENVLDIGCGTGDNLMLIKSIFPSVKVFGMDVTEIPLKIAQERIPDGVFWTDDVQDPKEIKGQFDLVTFLEVIEHLKEDMKALENISKITRKFLLLSTVGGKMREVEREIGHYRNYELKQLKDMLHSVGFRPKKIILWGFPFYSPVFRTIAERPQVVTFSYGEYGWPQKWVSQLLYGLYFLNLWTKGDKIIILAERI